MTREQCDFLCDALNFIDVDFQRRDGHAAPGALDGTYALVVVSPLDLVAALGGYVQSLDFAQEWAEPGALDAIPDLDDLRWDAFGRRYIVY
jgi:hypothetical protein